MIENFPIRPTIKYFRMIFDLKFETQNKNQGKFSVFLRKHPIYEFRLFSENSHFDGGYFREKIKNFSV